MLHTEEWGAEWLTKAGKKIAPSPWPGTRHASCTDSKSKAHPQRRYLLFAQKRQVRHFGRAALLVDEMKCSLRGSVEAPNPSLNMGLGSILKRSEDGDPVFRTGTHRLNQL